MAKTLGEHPSARFQRDEITTFDEAMTVYVEQFDYERRQYNELSREYGPYPSSEREQMMESHAATKRNVERARAIYDEIVTQALKRAAGAMRATGDNEMKMFADAVETGNYSGLAL